MYLHDPPFHVIPSGRQRHTVDDLTVGTLIRHGFGLDLKLYSTISFDFGEFQARFENKG